MVRKKTEGNEEQRRAAARDARESGTTPSAEQVTTGASKQRHDVPGSASHEERSAARHRGKPEWRAGDLAEADTGGGAPLEEPALDYTDRGRPPYTEEHETVYRALVTAMQRNDGDAVHVADVATAADRPAEQTRDLLHDLATVHHVVSVLEAVDDPDLGPRYEISPGR
ncbi:MAG: hypothetical protein J2P24_18195 [Streptosporangiales bacterium]|nr:hypothetical protein [Streptosporangiales bacterium]